MTKKVNAKVQKSQNQNSKNVKIHVEGKSGKELAAKVEKAVQSAVANAAKNEKPVEKPAPVKVPENKENLPAAKSDVFDLQGWYDKNLGAIDCEKCAWDLAQSVTMTEPAHDIKGHVHSDGKNMFTSNGKVLVILTTPVMPAGVYDPVLAGKGSAKRRTFIPVNKPNACDMLKKIESEANDPKCNPIIAEEIFDFSINAPLHDTIFAMQFFNAAHGFVLSDCAISTIVASCQRMKFKLGKTYSVLENDVLRIIFISSMPKKDDKTRVMEIIRKYKIQAPALIEAKEEKPEEKPAEQPKEKPAAPKFQVVKKPAEKSVKAKK